MLYAGGPAGLALVHQAVREGVFRRAPGLTCKVEQQRAGDDAVVVVSEYLLHVLGRRGLKAGRAAKRGHCRFGGVPGPFGRLARLMERHLTVLGLGYGGQGSQQSPPGPPDRLSEYLARPAFRQWRERWPD